MNYRYEDIRNFYFENEIGKRVNCQKINGNLFLYNVSGLGFKKSNDYVRVGNTFIKNKEEIEQSTITGELEFYEMTYDEYRNFIDFILCATSLKLIYVPKNTNRIEYYRDIDVIELEKNEEDDFNILTTPITINCTSLWYKQNNIIYNVENVEDELRWEFVWDPIFADYEHRSIIFSNSGHVEAPFLLEIGGYIENPKMEVIVNNKKIYEVTFNITLNENEKIVYSTKENDMYIKKINKDNTYENLSNLLDLNNINFFNLPKGTSEIKLEANTDILNAKLTIYEQYITV